MIDLQITFTSRPAGSLVSLPGGAMLEFLTQTWLRFTCALVVTCVAIIVIVSPLPPGEKFGLIMTSPIFALAFWYALLGCLLVCRYLGFFGQVLAHLLIICFFLFSRFVVQRPPKVWLPLTRR
jgi:hypothetical protein